MAEITPPRVDELVRALTEPSAYPQPPRRISLIQTQMSLVFIADDLVYKVKKPVNLGYLDYTTLDSRQFFCQQEVRLNQRLCPDVYLAVVGITRVDGALRVAEGRPVEYAVKMRRLPPEAMMNVLLARDAVTLEMIEGVARKLADFHERAETSPAISAFGELATIRTNTDENFSQTDKYLGRTITPAQYRQIKAYTQSFIKDNLALFRGRVASGKIRDCHGDLHAAHVCFSDGIQIYDCIEFNDRFRYCDVASEVAFLAMDLDHYGRQDLSNRFIDAYVAASQDIELRRLLGFYKCYRAYVRGKVEGFKLDDPNIPEAEKERTLGVARGYFELAEGYTN